MRHAPACLLLLLLLLGLLSVALLTRCAPARRLAASTQPPTTVYVVRHAEKASGSAPGLTPQGRARAEFYVEFFRAVDVAAVYATPTRRTQDTATPLATAKGLAVTNYPNGPTFATFGPELLAAHAGETIVVVGHGNTVPLLVNALSGETAYTDIPHDEYRRVYQVVVAPGDRRATVREFNVAVPVPCGTHAQE